MVLSVNVLLWFPVLILEQNIAGHEPLYLKDIRWRRTGRSAEIQMNVSQRMEAVSKCVLMNQVSASPFFDDINFSNALPEILWLCVQVGL